MLAILAFYDYVIWQMDVKTTFLNGFIKEELYMMQHYKKKTHPCHFGPNEKKFCHTYDTSMTIIVTKPGIIIDVVGSYFYDKKS